jgi:hypothetical protein
MIGNHYCIWQFNFREFDLKEDMFAHDSIELLKHSGIDFRANEERGINVQRFGELLMVSGVVLSEKVRHNRMLLLDPFRVPRAEGFSHHNPHPLAGQVVNVPQWI